MNRGVIYHNTAQLLNSSIGKRDLTVEVNVTDVEVQNSIHKLDDFTQAVICTLENRATEFNTISLSNLKELLHDYKNMHTKKAFYVKTCRKRCMFFSRSSARNPYYSTVACNFWEKTCTFSSMFFSYFCRWAIQCKNTVKNTTKIHFSNYSSLKREHR